MKMNKRILSYSGRLHPLSVCQRCGFLGTEEKKQPGENLSNGVDAGMGARATFVWYLSALRTHWSYLFSSLFPRETNNEEEKVVSWEKDKPLNCHANGTVSPYGSHSGKKQDK